MRSLISDHMLKFYYVLLLGGLRLSKHPLDMLMFLRKELLHRNPDVDLQAELVAVFRSNSNRLVAIDLVLLDNLVLAVLVTWYLRCRQVPCLCNQRLGKRKGMLAGRK